MRREGALAPASGRDISGSTTAVVVRYIRGVGGDSAVQRLLEIAGEPRPPSVLEDDLEWTSYGQAVALFEAAATLTGDEDVGRSIGQEQLRQHTGTEVAALLRSLGSPGEVLRNVALSAAKFSTVTAMEALEVGDGHAIITARTAPHLRRSPHLCRYTEGVLSQAPALFGFDPAVVAEDECQTRGDRHCVYRVVWVGSEGGEEDLHRRIADVEAQLSATTTRLESLQATASELVSAATVDEVLEIVIRRVALAVRAPRYLLAVRLRPGGPVRVHHRGFEDDATSVADEILEEVPDDRDGSRLVVDVASFRHHFGRLAALYPEGARFFPHEERLLAAYANHVSAVLDTAVALDDARRQNDTARTLLRLGRSLADVGSSDEVAARVASAVPAVVDCDVSAVALWDEASGELRVRASLGLSEAVQEQLAAVPFTPEQWPLLEVLIREQRPLFVDRAADDPFVTALLSLIGADTVVVVPVISRRRFLGVVCAAVRQHGDVLRCDDDLLERLSGLADHAATALENAALLDQVQHQALHDPLTGVPNQRLLVDRVEVALAQSQRDRSSVGLLFVDLDRFKGVNDQFGHAVGDQLLRAVVKRLEDELRAGDTIARVGGDEFVVLLPKVDGPGGVDYTAERLTAALEQPFHLGSTTVHLGGSVGRAVSPHDGSAYGVLLAHADASMYDIKRRRRGQVGRTRPIDPVEDARAT